LLAVDDGSGGRNLGGVSDLLLCASDLGSARALGLAAPAVTGLFIPETLPGVVGRGILSESFGVVGLLSPLLSFSSILIHISLTDNLCPLPACLSTVSPPETASPAAGLSL